jgi:DNA mismatch repair ATPase MutS
MAQGDQFLHAVALAALLDSVRTNLQTVLHRQAVLSDCMAQPALVRDLYALAVEALECERKVHFGYFSKSPDMIMRRAVEVLRIFMDRLRRLNMLAAEHAAGVTSAGLRTLFDTLQSELGGEYLGEVEEQLRQLEVLDELLIGVRLGKGNKGTDYRLCQAAGGQQKWAERIFGSKAPSYSFTVADRDLSGAQALVSLRDQGLNQVANALAQAGDRIQAFFQQLRIELAFYVGCLNLHEKLAAIGAPAAFPVPAPQGEGKLHCRGVYDVCLALVLGRSVVANDLQADGCKLMMITGANKGGKSTFLRGLGLAQLMMQCGMMVGAEAFCADLCEGLFTHFRREEDAGMDSGKLDEELARMSAIVDQLQPHALLLFNESFAATNEREGAEIARQIVLALVEQGIKVYFVTHLFTLAHELDEEHRSDVLFLRAERQADGGRTFRMQEGPPLATSYGADLYDRIFAP